MTAQTNSRETMLLDTSVIIDGRIVDIYATGFVRAQLLVPGFVLSELQHVADSDNTIQTMPGAGVGWMCSNNCNAIAPAPFK